MSKLVDLKSVRKAQEDAKNKVYEIVKSDPWVPITLKDGTYKLEFSYGAVKDVFRRTGKNLQNGEVTPQDIGDLDFMIAMMLDGLKANHPAFEDMELDTFSKKLSMRHMVYYAAMLNQALEAIQPDISDLERVYGELKQQQADEDSRELPFVQDSKPS